MSLSSPQKTAELVGHLLSEAEKAQQSGKKKNKKNRSNRRKSQPDAMEPESTTTDVNALVIDDEEANLRSSTIAAWGSGGGAEQENVSSAAPTNETDASTSTSSSSSSSAAAAESAAAEGEAPTSSAFSSTESHTETAAAVIAADVAPEPAQDTKKEDEASASAAAPAPVAADAAVVDEPAPAPASAEPEPQPEPVVDVPPPSLDEPEAPSTSTSSSSSAEIVLSDDPLAPPPSALRNRRASRISLDIGGQEAIFARMSAEAAERGRKAAQEAAAAAEAGMGEAGPSVQCMPGRDPFVVAVTGVDLGADKLFDLVDGRIQFNSAHLKLGSGAGNEKSFMVGEHVAFDFDLDAVYGMEVPQVFRECVKPLVDNAVKRGDSGTVLGFGQSHDNKSKMLLGDLNTPANAGLIPASVNYLFELIQHTEAKTNAKFNVAVTMLEIYCERVYDLLAAKKTVSTIRESNSVFFVDGATKKVIKEAKECPLNRCLAVTSAAQSAVITSLHVERVDWDEIKDGEPVRKHALLQFVILPGSEAADFAAFGASSGAPAASPLSSSTSSGSLGGSSSSSSGSSSGSSFSFGSGARITPTAASVKTAQRGVTLAHQSLFALDKVINALNTEASYVPYRDSSITKLLKGGLGEAAHCVFIGSVVADPVHVKETLSTLRFATRCKVAYAFQDAAIPEDPQSEAVVKALFSKKFVPNANKLPFDPPVRAVVSSAASFGERGAAPPMSAGEGEGESESKDSAAAASVASVASNSVVSGLSSLSTSSGVGNDDDDEDIAVVVKGSESIKSPTELATGIPDGVNIRRRASAAMILAQANVESGADATSPPSVDPRIEEIRKLSEKNDEMSYELTKCALLIKSTREERDEAVANAASARASVEAANAEMARLQTQLQEAQDELKRLYDEKAAAAALAEEERLRAEQAEAARGNVMQQKAAAVRVIIVFVFVF